MTREAHVEAALVAAARAAGDLAALRAWLDEWGHDETLLVAVLQRGVSARLLELIGLTRPWCERARVAAAVARQPRTPAHVSQRLLPGLFWRDLADIASGPYLPGVVRLRAESLLIERLPDMRRGDRVALARLATRALLRALLAEPDALVVDAALLNPRLSEEALVTLLRARDATRVLLEGAAASPRWRANYAVRLALVLQPHTPLGLALAQVTALVPADLRRAAAQSDLRPLLRGAAERALLGPGPPP